MSEKEISYKREQYSMPPSEPGIQLIVSVAVFAHGCEDFSKPLSDPGFSVRVYSRACVPGVISIGNVYENQRIIPDIWRQFADMPTSETMRILDEYAERSRPLYKERVEKSVFDDARFARSAFDKALDPKNVERSSGLSAFLFDKTFTFDDDSRKEGGIHVVDIRKKITGPDGSVSYEPVLAPGGRMDMSNFNLIYKNGVSHILKDVLHQKGLVKEALGVLGFVGRKERIAELSLGKLYAFFQLLGVQYVNIMDHSCRSCAEPMPPPVLARFYDIEQERVIKGREERFGGTRNKRRRRRRNTKRC